MCLCVVLWMCAYMPAGTCDCICIYACGGQRPTLGASIDTLQLLPSSSIALRLISLRRKSLTEPGTH